LEGDNRENWGAAHQPLWAQKNIEGFQTKALLGEQNGVECSKKKGTACREGIILPGEKGKREVKGSVKGTHGKAVCRIIWSEEKILGTGNQNTVNNKKDANPEAKESPAIRKNGAHLSPKKGGKGYSNFLGGWE